MSRRLVQVGLGHVGKNWARRIAHYLDAQCVAWVEVDYPGLMAHADEHGFDKDRCFASLDDAIAAVAADGAVVATPPEVHEESCLKALHAGWHVLCEKPLSVSLDSARKMVEAAEAAGRILMVGQNRRFLRYAATLRRLVQEAPLGGINQVFVTFHQQFTRSSFRDSMEHPLLVDMANHHFDVIRHVLQREPVEVRGFTWNPQDSRFVGDASASILFTFADGMPLNYQGNWCAPDCDMTSNGCTWRIECQHGVLVARDDRVFMGNIGDQLTEVALEPMQRELGEFLIHDFCQSITDGSMPVTNGRDNLNSVAMVFGAVEAVDTGKIVKLRT